MQGFSLHPSASGLLVVAVEIPPPSLWLPPAAQAQLPAWRREWAWAKAQQANPPRPGGYQRYPLAAPFSSTEEFARDYLHRFAMMFAPSPRSMFGIPMEREDRFASTRDDIRALPETPEPA